MAEPGDRGRRGLFGGLLQGIQGLRDLLDGHDPEAGPSFVPPAPGAAGTAPNKVTRPPRRPPGALPEAEFLAACTKCGACVEVCPESTLAPDAQGYPVADLERHPCVLCAQVPCVAACEPRALRPLGRFEIRLGVARVHTRLCLNHGRPAPIEPSKIEVSAPGELAELDEDDNLDEPDEPEDAPPCERCLDWCMVPGALVIEPRGAVPRVDASLCTGCGLCAAHCAAYPRALSIR